MQFEIIEEHFFKRWYIAGENIRMLLSILRQ